MAESLPPAGDTIAAYEVQFVGRFNSDMPGILPKPKLGVAAEARRLLHSLEKYSLGPT